MAKKQIFFRLLRVRTLSVSAAAVLMVFGVIGMTFMAQTHSVQAAAGINKAINFQGKVVNTNGTNVADGSYTFRFRIYNHASNDATNSCSANSCLWEESKSLTTTNGIFQTNLGDTTTLPGSVDFNTDTLYIGIKFNGDTEMTPRIRLTSVPYAFNADMLDGLDSSSLVQLSPSGAQSGNINITGNVTSGGSVNAASIDSNVAGALQVGGSNATSIALAKNTTMSSSFTLALQGNNSLNLGSTTAAGGIVFKDGTVNNRAVTLSTIGLTASYTINLPDTAPSSGNQCLQSATGSTTNLMFGTCSGGSGFVSLQATTPGTADTGNVNVSGVIIAGTKVLSSAFDTAAAGQLSLGTTTATSVVISRSGIATTIAAGLNTKDITIGSNNNVTFTGGSGAFDMSGATGTFKTGTGAVTLNGDTTLATGKILSVVGSASTDLLYNSKVTGDTNQRLTIGADGKLQWGAGNAAQDINLYRTGSGTLATNASIRQLNGAAGRVALSLSGAASQTADLLQNQDVNGAILSAFGAGGALTTYGTTTNLLGLATPVISGTSTATTGGTLAAGTYWYVVTATNGSETVASTSSSRVTTGATSTVTVNWTAVNGATGYKIYRNTSNAFGSGSLLLATISNGTTATYLDTGTATSAGLPPTAPAGSKLVLQGWASQTSNMFELKDAAGNVNSAFSGSGNQLMLGRVASSGTVLQGSIVLADGTTDNFGSTLNTSTLTASRTISLPDASGTICLQSSASCGFAVGTAASYIQNQSASAQTTASFWISGTGRADTALQAPLLDAATAATALAIGTTNANAINLNQNTTVASGKTFTTNGVTTVKSLSSSAFSIQDASNNTLFNFDTTNGNITLATGAARTIAVGAATGAGNNLVLTGGAAGGTNQNGGNTVLSGGAGIGTGVQGLVSLAPTTFATASTQTNTIAAGLVDQYSTIPVTANTTGLTITVPSPVNAVTGRVLYITALSGSNDFTLLLSGTSIQIAIKSNSTATLIWNGTGWTAAGASSSTDLQSAYNNTLTSAGGAELILNNTASSDGLTIRNNPTSPILGPLFEVQSAIGTNLLSVNGNATELIANGGAETSSSFATDWTSVGAPTITRHTTLANVATGQASVQVATTAASNTGVRNNMATAPAVSSTYQVSFTGKLSAGTFSTLDVQYSRNGGTTLTACGSYSTTTLTTTGWSKVTCTFTTDATTATDADLIIRQTDATSRTFWVDNLSVTIITATSTPPNVQIGGGLYGGAATVLTLDRASTAPVANGNNALLGSMYYDTTSGRIQCYEADGWGACGSAPDNYVNLVPEYSGAVLNGTGIGTLTADFCSNQTSVLQVNTSLCGTGQALNFYKWTSPQATQQTYSVYVTYQLPAAFKQFQSDTTVQLTARTDNTTNGIVTYQMFRSESGTLAACGTETTVTSSANTWQTVGINGNELTGCGFTSSSANNFAIFKINVKANSNANVYIGTLSFTTTGQ